MLLFTIETSSIIFIAIAVVLLIFIFLIVHLLKEKKLDKEEIRELIDDLNEEKIDNQVLKNQTDLENLLIRMQDDLEAKSEDVINHFENDQEENSIISYQELVSTLKQEKPIEIEEAKVETIDIEDHADGKVEPIKTEVKTDLGEITKVEIPEIKEAKKFKVTEFISPIYGKQEISNDYPKVEEFKHHNRLDEILMQEDNNTHIEEDIVLDPLREEIRRNDEFLQALKEFRKNL